MKLTIKTPQGIYPRINENDIGFQAAQTAENIDISDGQIRPWDNYLLDRLLNIRGILRTIELYVSTYWLEFDADVDIVYAPVSGDTENKFYFTGSGIPKKSNLTEATTGSGTYPINYFPLAVPSPKVAASAANDPPPAGSGDDRYIQYIWTVVTDWGEEGYPSPASTALLAAPGENTALSGMSLIWVTGTVYEENDVVYPTASEGGTYMYICVQGGTSGGSEPTWNETVDGNTLDGTVVWRCFKNNLAYKRIYRLSVGDEYANYQYVTAIAITETAVDESLEDDELGVLCPSLNIDDGGASDEDWDPPPQDLLGITYIGKGIVLGFVGKDLYACIPYRPWAWPIAYIKSLKDDIVAISSSGSGNVAVVTTTGKPVIVLGTAPGSLVDTALNEEKPNLSKRGTESWEGFCIYPAADGLRAISSDGNNQLLTMNQHDSKTWAELYPETMHGYIHNNKYFGFYSNGTTEGGIVFDLQSKRLTTLDFYCFAAYVDTNEDKLYFLRSTAMSGFSEIWTNPDAASASGKATQYDLDGGAGVMAALVQPDYARNAILTLAGGNVTAISITISGTNSEGETDTTEDFDFDDFTAGTATGNVAWAEIDSVTINSVTGSSGDTLDLGHGKKFGLGNDIDAETDIIKINENNDDADVDDLTISTTYNTVQFETDPDAANDYQIWYNA